MSDKVDVLRGRELAHSSHLLMASEWVLKKRCNVGELVVGPREPQVAPHHFLRPDLSEPKGGGGCLYGVYIQQRHACYA